MTSSTQVYRVVGQHPVLGIEPGGRIQAADLPDHEQLARLVARGSLEPIAATTPSSAAESGGKEKD